jgi:hypothetical protein
MIYQNLIGKKNMWNITWELILEDNGNEMEMLG